MRSFDYVVVGAGSSGCALAGRLSEDAEVSVLVIEAGSSDDIPDLDVPIAAPRFLNSPCDWSFRSAPEPGLDGRVIELSHGRVLGGSSAINGMVYLRGSRDEYDAWARGGADGWGYDDVLPYFRRAEDYEGGADEYRGTGGPLSVSRGQFRHPLTTAFVAATAEAGYPYNDDLNGADREGFGYTQVTQRRGRRCSAARAYLHPALARPNLTVLVESTVVGLVFDGDKAAGVRVRRGTVLTDIRAEREVLLAAGAYHSPQLLMLAGIGPAAALREFGIPVRVDLPVGIGLQDHIRFSLVFDTPLSSLGRTPSAAERAEYEAHGTGPMSSNVGEAVGYVRSTPEAGVADYQISVAAARVAKMISVGGDGVSLVGWQACPTSRGWLRLRSADPEDWPVICHNYLDTETDRTVAVNGALRMMEIAEQPAFRKVIVGDPVAPPSRRYEDVLAWARRTGMTVHHPCSTCPVGAVVGADLRVFGTSGLRVVDASVMPSVPGANTNATTIMIGEKGADLVRESKA